MNLITIKRIFRAGFLDFWRNGFVSFASILVMTVTLFVVGTAIFSGVILNSALSELHDKADINVYFTIGTASEKILEMQKLVSTLPEVASTKYISADEALTQFRTQHQNDQLTLQSLEELGNNPFGAVLTIKAKEISQYDIIAKFLQQQQGLSANISIIDKINYFDIRHRQALDKLQTITVSAKRLGFIIVLILIFTTIAISFNTLRLAIYTSRDEIHIMRLVGASQFYIRAPFIVEGMLYGLIAGIVTLLLFYPLTYWLGNATAVFFGGINIFHYYLSNFPIFFLIIVGTGVLVGVISSFLAVRRYLKI